MNLSQIIQNISIQYPYKILIMIVILFLSTPLLLVLTIIYKQATDPWYKQKFGFNPNLLKHFFNDTFMIKGYEKTSFFLKSFCFIQIISVLYVIFYPVNSENSLIVFFIYGSVNILLFALDYLSENSSQIQYQTGKKIRLIFENFFLVLIVLFLIRILNGISGKNELIRFITIFLAFLNKTILFILLFLIRESLSVDLYRNRKQWISRFSHSGEHFYQISDQLIGMFLIIFYINVSFSRDGWLLETANFHLSSHIFPVFLWISGPLFFLIADVVHRFVLNCLPIPEERYLIKLNNLVLLPAVILSILIIVSLK